jgi:hypothetical protein
MDALRSDFSFFRGDLRPVPKEHTAEPELTDTSSFEAHVRQTDVIPSLNCACVNLSYCNRRVVTSECRRVVVERWHVML